MRRFSNKIRSIARYNVLNILGLFAKPKPGVHILGGHKITNACGSGSIADRERFDKLLCNLEKHCKLVRIEDALSLIINRTEVNEPIIAFTFDDGFDDCYDSIAPVLEKHGVNALFFINPNAATAASNHEEDYIINFANIVTVSPGKRPMTWEKIKDLKRRGFLFGAHTMDHYMLNHGSLEELSAQIKNCKPIIEEKLGVSCDYFAWPYGTLANVNEKSIDIATETYPLVFSQTDYKHYYSFDNKVLNRRHFEPWWPYLHVKYFISCHKAY